jgi:hypothetical protein
MLKQKELLKIKMPVMDLLGEKEFAFNVLIYHQK